MLRSLNECIAVCVGILSTGNHMFIYNSILLDHEYQNMLLIVQTSISIYSEDVMDQIVELLDTLLSQDSLFSGFEEGELPPNENDKREQEEEIIQVC